MMYTPATDPTLFAYAICCACNAMTTGRRFDDSVGCAGIPATVVAAASFDDMIAITGYTIFIDIAVTPPGNQVWSIMHGPLSVVFGILAGFLAAYLCAFTKLWNNKIKRTAAVLLAALFMKFIFDKYGFTSGGALGSLTLGLLVKELWARGQPGPFALKETNGEFIRSVRLY